MLASDVKTLLTNSMEQSPSGEADNLAANQEIPHFLCNLI
jgi:hypothetical protein